METFAVTRPAVPLAASKILGVRALPASCAIVTSVRTSESLDELSVPVRCMSFNEKALELPFVSAEDADK